MLLIFLDAEYNFFTKANAIFPLSYRYQALVITYIVSSVTRDVSSRTNARPPAGEYPSIKSEPSLGFLKTLKIPRKPKNT